MHFCAKFTTYIFKTSSAMAGAYLLNFVLVYSETFLKRQAAGTDKMTSLQRGADSPRVNNNYRHWEKSYLNVLSIFCKYKHMYNA